MDAHSALAVEDIKFYPLSANEWRVSDDRFPQQSIEALLGFVAQKGNTYYATRMRHPRETSPLRSLDAVASFFAEDAQTVLTPEMGSEFSSIRQ